MYKWFRSLCLLHLGVLASLVVAEVRLKDVTTVSWASWLASAPDRVIPRYENGFILSHSPYAPDITVFDETGNPMRDIRILIPEASSIHIESVAISREGQLVASVDGYSSDGKMVNALAWVNSAGVVEKIVRTTPFVARHISFAADGTLWALGDVYDTTFTNKPVGPYDVLWHFDGAGKLLKTALSSSTFQSPYPVATLSQLAVASNKIGVFFELRNEWVEVSMSGEILGRHTVPLPSRSTLVRVVATPSGDVLFQQSESASASVRQETKRDDVEAFYLFDKESGTINTVNVASIEGIPLLLGANDNTVLWRGSKSRARQLVHAALAR